MMAWENIHRDVLREFAVFAKPTCAYWWPYLVIPKKGGGYIRLSQRAYQRRQQRDSQLYRLRRCQSAQMYYAKHREAVCEKQRERHRRRDVEAHRAKDRAWWNRRRDAELKAAGTETRTCPCGSDFTVQIGNRRTARKIHCSRKCGYKLRQRRYRAEKKP